MKDLSIVLNVIIAVLEIGIIICLISLFKERRKKSENDEED